jgi:hypothetical protein
MSLAAQFAVRDLHVSATPLQCVRHVFAKLDPTKRKGRAFRTLRHALMRAALEAHEANRNLYMTRRF